MELFLALLGSGLVLVGCGIWAYVKRIRDVNYLLRKAAEQERATKIAPKDPRVNVNWRREKERRALH